MTDENYSQWTRRPIAYLAVSRQGKVIGYLWAARGAAAAGFERKLSVVGNDLDILFAWDDRLSDAYAGKLEPLAAIERWIGAPEDPVAGGIPADAQLTEATGLEQMWNELNPDGPPLGPGPLEQDGMFPDGTPVNPAGDWGPLVSAPPAPTYATKTLDPVHFLPVGKDNVVLGWLWAAVTGRAASFLTRPAAGKDGELAAAIWRMRLSDAYAANLSAPDALRHSRTYPADELAGAVDQHAELRTAPNVETLEQLAGQ